MNYRLAAPAALALMLAAYLGVATTTSTFMLYGFPIMVGIVGAALLARIEDAERPPLHHAITALRLYYGAHLLWSSLRYWFTDMQPVIPHPVGGPFIELLTAMGVFPAIKAMEGLIGAMLLANRYVPLMLVLEMPTSVTIFYLNTIVTATPRTVITGPAELAVNALLLLGYFRYYQPFLVARAEPAPPRFGRGISEAGPSSAPT
jgi:hypothetical protein